MDGVCVVDRRRLRDGCAAAAQRRRHGSATDARLENKARVFRKLCGELLTQFNWVNRIGHVNTSTNAFMKITFLQESTSKPFFPDLQAKEALVSL